MECAEETRFRNIRICNPGVMRNYCAVERDSNGYSSGGVLGVAPTATLLTGISRVRWPDSAESYFVAVYDCEEAPSFLVPMQRSDYSGSTVDRQCKCSRELCEHDWVHSSLAFITPTPSRRFDRDAPVTTILEAVCEALEDSAISVSMRPLFELEMESAYEAGVWLPGIRACGLCKFGMRRNLSSVRF